MKVSVTIMANKTTLEAIREGVAFIRPESTSSNYLQVNALRPLWHDLQSARARKRARDWLT